MTATDFDHALVVLASALTEQAEDTITGSRLGELITKVAPSINVRDVVGVPAGPGALSKFIDQHLSQLLQRSGRKGGDVEYRIIRAGDSAAPGGDLDPPNTWSAFASTSERQNLYVGLPSLDLQVRPNDGTAPPEGLRKIRSVTQEDLDRIRQQFLDDLSADAALEGQKSALAETKDYTSWLATLRAIGNSEYVRWGQFRRQQLESIFADRLHELGIDGEQARVLLERLQSAQRSAAQRRASLRQAAPTTPAASQEPGVSEEFFRNTLIAALSRMSISELRQLHLPYGAVIDAMRNPSRK